MSTKLHEIFQIRIKSEISLGQMHLDILCRDAMLASHFKQFGS